MLDVTAIMVCYNTRALACRAYESFRQFYPAMPLIVIDNSDAANPCASYVRSLRSDTTQVLRPGRNIGHGPGMHMGITRTRTPYALIFDSDVVFVGDCVRPMLEQMTPETFGVGKIVRVDTNGDNKHAMVIKRRAMNSYYMSRIMRQRNSAKIYYSYYQTSLKKIISYLHPFCHLINIANYKRFRPYVDHGAPCLWTMVDIQRKKLSGSLLVNFPDLRKYVKHNGRGTRNIMPQGYWRQWKHLPL